jgi:hypothetical protein
MLTAGRGPARGMSARHHAVILPVSCTALAVESTSPRPAAPGFPTWPPLPTSPPDTPAARGERHQRRAHRRPPDSPIRAVNNGHSVCSRAFLPGCGLAVAVCTAAPHQARPTAINNDAGR